jgi:hypothetical protein
VIPAEKFQVFLALALIYLLAALGTGSGTDHDRGFA